MNADDFKQAWQTQPVPPPPAINREFLLTEVNRNQRYFAAMIFWRDVREVGVALVMIPIWIYLGIRFKLPWTWYLTLPALLWIIVFMLVDRRRHQPRQEEPSDSLRDRIQNSLAQVEHQIWLLKNVIWWYLLPFAIPIVAFFAQVGWQTCRSIGPAMFFAFVMSLVVVVMYAAVWKLNQFAVTHELEPRRQELAALLASLQDEPPVE